MKKEEARYFVGKAKVAVCLFDCCDNLKLVETSLNYLPTHKDVSLRDSDIEKLKSIASNINKLRMDILEIGIRANEEIDSVFPFQD